MKDYVEDPLNIVGKLRARTSNELLKVRVLGQASQGSRQSCGPPPETTAAAAAALQQVRSSGQLMSGGVNAAAADT